MLFFLLSNLCVIGATRPVDNIEYIIIFMQENRCDIARDMLVFVNISQSRRAFDHYFGSMKGVRGFNDRVTVPLRSGHSVFYQPTDQEDLSNYMLPFRVDIQVTQHNSNPKTVMPFPLCTYNTIYITRQPVQSAWMPPR